jgi:enediyne biosynthesis protein E4
MLAITLGLAALTGCQRAVGRPDSLAAPVRFVDVASRAGIHFRHTNGQSGRYFAAETMGSGCAFLDYDGDGRLDLFLVNSSRLPGFKGNGPYYPALFHNEGSGRFREVTRQAGLGIDCYGMGVAVGDYDNDGDPDLLLTAYGGSHLFHNHHGHFTETRQAGVTKPRWGTSAAWFDYDRGGYLDLFIGNYFDWTPATNRVCGQSGHQYACDPTYYQGSTSVLYHNNRDGTFTDVTRQAGVDRPNGKALGVAVWDADGDGWPDFAVANDTEPNWLFHNTRNGTFTERGVEAGIG